MDARPADERSPAYRRMVIGVTMVLGVAVGLGVGSVASITGSLLPLVLPLILLGLHAIGVATGRLTGGSRVATLWPLLAFAVAVVQVVMIPRDLAPFLLALSVATWFCLLIVSGILEVLLDPGGRWG